MLAMLLTLPAAALAQSAPAAPAPGAQTSPPPPPAPPPVFNVTVIETAPLPGVDVPLEKIPAPVQTVTGREIEASGALDLAEYLNRRLSGVHVNEIQGNPFQPDVSYRGYTASPLLGTPQGLSIYMDGVRLNQPFGDVVSWDLIPRVAIASTTLMPGSNPLFGLNTLGGALSIQTKDGRSARGTSVQATYGSSLRRAIEFEHGGSRPSGLHWYMAGNLFGEDGWRDDSPSDVRQVFGKLGWQKTKHDVALTLAYANNSLTGNGLQEGHALERASTSVYTKPDVTDNRSTFLNIATRHSLNSQVAISGNVYYRDIRTNTVNGDINEDSLNQSVYQPGAAEREALAAAGYTGVPASGATAENTPFPSWRCIGNVLLRDEPGEKCNGLLNRTHSTQPNAGAAAQLTRHDAHRHRTNQLTAGTAFDRSHVGFQQTTQLGYLNPDRSVTGLDAFGDGVTGGNVDGEPYDTRVDLDGIVHTVSVYAADTLSIGSTWSVTASGRYNRTTIRNRDRIDPGGGVGSLDGDHAFSRFNPAAGITYSPTPAVNLYLGYSEGSRAATSIEFGCANPEVPCKLPNAMAGDPPLHQVVTRTWESGVRGQRKGVSWNAGLFRAENRDDILFVTSGQTGFGYFKNFGKTRRQGIELGVSRQMRRLALGAGYTFLDATYQSAETLNGGSNSTNDAALDGDKGLEGTIHIEPGDRMPLIPQHMLKAYAEIRATAVLSLNLDVAAVSSSYARGNENNQHEADDTYYIGPGTSPGYTVVNLGATYRVKRRPHSSSQTGRAADSGLELFVQINNLFDRRYDTAAQLGPYGLTDGGAFIARPFPAVNGEFPVRQATFYAPGAPIRAWIGARAKF